VGNPGTGKTTVARLFATLLRKLGLLPSDTFVETDRSGLIGRYVGETETKTRELIGRADGGVLFIDEAYALNDRYNEHKGFGEEAVDVLVKQMEDLRETLVVVFAGYKKPMEAFLSVNPGLRSRIPATIEFPDYSPAELLEIADRLAKRRDLRLDEGARSRFGEVLGTMRSREGFGNARDVENVMDVAQRNLVARVAALGNLATEAESSSIVAADIPLPEEAEAQRRIGFARHMYL
jgi:AAA+ superfamily predicted ATPase